MGLLEIGPLQSLSNYFSEKEKKASEKGKMRENGCFLSCWYYYRFLVTPDLQRKRETPQYLQTFVMGSQRSFSFFLLPFFAFVFVSMTSLMSASASITIFVAFHAIIVENKIKRGEERLRKIRKENKMEKRKTAKQQLLILHLYQYYFFYFFFSCLV